MGWREEREARMSREYMGCPGGYCEADHFSELNPDERTREMLRHASTHLAKHSRRKAAGYKDYADCVAMDILDAAAEGRLK
jgi:hypothetical protein